MSGPLAGYRVIELAGIGPGPFCAMMLADMGADVIRIDRINQGTPNVNRKVIERGRRRIGIDLKEPESRDIVLDLVSRAHVLIEGFRPGVMERLGLGPDVCLTRNKKLIYGRMTGWGQTGSLSGTAGHDINYLSITGVLHAIGYSDRPPSPPLHVIGDLGGGAMMLAYGIVCAMLEATKSGKGQIIDAAIHEGVSLLASNYHHMISTGEWVEDRQANILDGGSHFYGCYECLDGKYISIGPIEPKFYGLFLELCDIDDPDFREQFDRNKWPALRKKLEMIFIEKSRDEWCKLLERTDVCFAPVLSFKEAQTYSHNMSRKSFIKSDGITYPAPAPKLSRTPAEAGPFSMPGQHTIDILQELGISSEDIAGLKNKGVVS